MEYFHKNHSGDVISRLTNDMGGIRGIIGGQAFSLLQIPLDGIVAVMYGLKVNWQITLILLIIAPLPLISNYIFNKRLRETSQEAHKLWSRIYSFVTDIFKGTDIVKTYEIKDALIDKLQERYDENLKVELKLTKLGIGLTLGANLVSNLSILIPSIIGAFLILNGKLRLGDVVAFISILSTITQPFFTMPGVIGGFQRGTAAAQRVLEVLDTEGEEYGEGKLLDISSIEFKDVSFSYDSVNALSGASLSINRGMKVGVVGASGCGKSTLIKMLLGFYRPRGGDILINDKSLFSYNLKNVREVMAYVPQEPYLFAGSIKDNILLGKPDASEEEWRKAAEISLVDEFVAELPEGYNTLIGQNGMNLSGGQRQRIGVARALIKGVPLLILDEATSSLDNETERRLYEGLDSIETVIAIAHRLSTLRDFDIIYVMDKGKVVEMGDHTSLLEARGYYFQLERRGSNDKEITAIPN